jgi:hypothetical protein
MEKVSTPQFHHSHCFSTPIPILPCTLMEHRRHIEAACKLHPKIDDTWSYTVTEDWMWSLDFVKKDKKHRKCNYDCRTIMPMLPDAECVNNEGFSKVVSFDMECGQAILAGRQHMCPDQPEWDKVCHTG